MIYHIAMFLLPVFIFYLMWNSSSDSALSFYLFVKAFFWGVGVGRVLITWLGPGIWALQVHVYFSIG